MSDRRSLSRREALGVITGVAASSALEPAPWLAAETPGFRLRYILGSCMYGTTKLAEILPEVKKIGAEHIDIWPRVHGDQREQVETMGIDRFAEMLAKHKVKLGIITQYKLGPYRLQGEMKVVKKLGGSLLICGSAAGSGKTLRDRVRSFAESMKPHIAAAEKHRQSLITAR